MKKILALLLSISMIASMNVMAYPDVQEGTPNAAAINTLSKLDVFNGFEDGTFKPEDNVSRGQMAKVICYTLGYKDLLVKDTVFTDVDATHWASGYVSMANNLGIINGYGDGTFRPDDAVLYEEAITMIMRALGYEVVAVPKGGYPAGYIAVATQEGVTDGVVNAIQGTYANRATIAQLLANAIDTPLVEQATWNSDGTGEYIKYDGTSFHGYKTVLSEYLDVVKIKGIVTNTPFAEDSTYNAEEVEKISISVSDIYNSNNPTVYDWLADTVEFNSADTNAADYLHYSVIAYVHENADGEWDIISISADSGRNATITFAIEDLAEAITEDTTKVGYYKNDNKTTARLAEGFDIYVNGESVDAYTVEENTNGTITLVDNDKTAGYEVVLVQTVDTDIIDDVTATKITFKNGNISTIKYTDDETKVVIKKNGVVIEAAELEENDVVSMTTKPNYIAIEVLTKVIEGKISGTKGSEDDKSYKINDVYYTLALGVANEDLKKGYEGIFYLNAFDEIVYYVGTANIGKIGYVLGVSGEEEDKWGNIVQEVKLLTVDGVKTYELAENYTVDGVEADIAEDTLIRFNLVNGKIKKVYTPSEDNNFELVEANFEKKWAADDNAFGSKEIDINTVVFSIDTEDADDSFIATIGDFVDENTYTVDLYATDDVRNDANIIIVRDLHKDIDAKAEYAIVVDIEETTNDDEEDIYELTVIYKGEKDTYKTTAAIYAEETIEIGDVVSLKINSNDVITKIVLVEGIELVRNNAEVNMSNNDNILAGYAYYINNNKVHVAYNETPDVEVVRFDRARRIYFVQTTGRNNDGIKVTEGTVKDILWDRDLTVELEEGEYEGKNVANIEAELEEGNAANVFTQIYVVYTEDEDEDMIFLVEGEEDYEVR